MVLDLLDQFTNRSSELVSQQNVAIQVFESQCPPRSALIARYLARDLRHGRQRVAPFYHDLGLDFFGLIGNFWIVAQLVHPVVEQLLNPILSSSHVSMTSLAVVEETCMLSHIRLLQSSISQLSEYNKLEVFLEE